MAKNGHLPAVTTELPKIGDSIYTPIPPCIPPTLHLLIVLLIRVKFGSSVVSLWFTCENASTVLLSFGSSSVVVRCASGSRGLRVVENLGGYPLFGYRSPRLSSCVCPPLGRPMVIATGCRSNRIDETHPLPSMGVCLVHSLARPWYRPALLGVLRFRVAFCVPVVVHAVMSSRIAYPPRRVL